MEASMKRNQIEGLELIESGLVFIEPSLQGRPLVVNRFFDRQAGKVVDVETEGDFFRETPAAETQWEIVELGPWKKLCD
jgi:hypothetical protein